MLYRAACILVPFQPIAPPVPTESHPMQTQGYITDVAYTDHYYAQLAPVLLAYVAALNGFVPPPIRDFDYCEIGCGNGLSLNLHAAANPQARFVGIDLNPEHIANARAVAEDGGLRNLRYFALDVATAEHQSLPAFDYITLHGVYSWVSEAVRAQIVQFLRNRLKPGGAVMVSYNVLPGWAGLAPLREMLLSYTAGMPGMNSVERARHGLGYLQFMAEKGAAYFVQNPSAGEQLKDLQKQDLRYVAHEFFNYHWNPLYFSQVAREMMAAELMFCGSIPIEQNYAELTVPQPLHEMLKTAPSRNAVESNKDFACNTRFRNDVYVRGAPSAAPQAPDPALFRDFAFGLATPVEALKLLQVSVGLVTMDLSGAIFPVIAQVLGDRAQTVAQLQSLPELAGATAEQILGALQKLVVAQQATPFVCGADPYPGAAARLGFSRYNEAALGRLMTVDAAPQAHLASRYAGTAVRMGKHEALACLALSHSGSAGPVAWAQQWLRARNMILLPTEAQAGAPETALIQQAIDAIGERERRLFFTMGVLEPAGDAASG
ncbi:MAG: methyltransferase domain-containing protein [Gammaproteobacteria bacterium]|nr:methyltransferase domain-containing protein [Gammaproteobacteria bacterium]